MSGGEERPGRAVEVDDGRHARPEEALVGGWLHGRYEVTAELGWGSLGHVYLARDHLRVGPDGPLEVALKLIRRDRLGPRSVEYLKREFRALARIRHPNVARVHDLDVVPGRGALFFSLEPLRGRTLVQAVAELGWEAGLDLFVQALRALAHVHARGLVHMDLKPQNVLVVGAPGPGDRGGQGGGLRVKLLDFHLVRDPTQGDDRAMRGTIAYMAPEVIRGDAVDHRADLYGFGALCYHALAGAPPFAGLSGAMSVLRAHTSEPPAALRARGVVVPPALEAIVLRLLEKQPAARFASANEVIRALNAGLGRDFALETEETLALAFEQAPLAGRDGALEALVRRCAAALAVGAGPGAGAAAGAAAGEAVGAPTADARPAGGGAEGGGDATSGAEGGGDGAGGPPWVVRVVGEAGAGKSRLLAEAKVALQLEGLACVAVRPEGPDAAPWGPLHEALRELGRRAHGSAHGATGVVAPGKLAALAGPDGALDPARLAAAGGALEDLPARLVPSAVVLELLREAAAACPAALLLDDLAACDPSTLEVLRALARGPRPAGLVVVVAARDDEPDPLAEEAALPSVATLPLGRLGRAHVRDLVAGLAGGREVPDAFVERVWALTGGNPRFVEETLRNLVEGGALRTREGALAVGPRAALDLLDDASLRELVARRVARLEPDPTLLLAATAACPRPRPLAFVAATAALPLARAQAALAPLERRGLVVAGRVVARALGPELWVEHEALREAALAAVGPERRRALHAQAGRLLEARHPVAVDPGGQGGDRAEELRHHLERAGRLRDAARHAREAADAAAGRRELARAREGYAQALALLERAARGDGTEGGRGPDALDGRGPGPAGASPAGGAEASPRAAASSPDPARAATTVAARSAAADEEARLEVTLRLAEVLAATGLRREAIGRLRELVAHADPPPRALRLLARLQKDLGDLDAALAAADAAVLAAGPGAEDAAPPPAGSRRPDWAPAGSRRPDRAAPDADGSSADGPARRAGAPVEGAGDVAPEREVPGPTDERAVERARGLAERASVRLWRADYAGAREDARRALAGLEGPGREADALEALDVLHHASRFLGDDEGAAAWLRRALELDGRRRRGPHEADDEAGVHPSRVEAGRAPLLGDAHGAHVPRTLLEAAYERARRDDELVRHLRRREDLLLAAGDRDGAAYALLGRGHLLRARGDAARALEAYRRAVALFEATDCVIGAALGRLSLARALADLGAGPEAAAAATAAAALARRCGARWVVAQAALARSEAAWAAGDAPEARAALDEAAELALALGNVPITVEVELARAERALAADPPAPAAPPDAPPAADAALDRVEAAPAGARSVALDLRARLARARLAARGASPAAAAAAGAPGEGGAAGPRELARAEGLAARALEDALALDWPELVWRARWARAQVRRARADREGELEDLVAALEVLRGLGARLPEDLRAAYLGHPDRRPLGARFQALRAGPG